MSAVLTFKDVCSGYGDTEILHGVSGTVREGETLGVFGRNGVGKTTLSRTLVGELPTLKGEIFFNDQALGKRASFARRRSGLSYMPQTGMVFDSLSVRENLSLANSILPVEPYFEILPRLAERLNQLAGSMSGGERKILSFVRIMLEDTTLAVLDEPSEGVQPENIENMQTCIRKKQETGTAFILVEQNLTMLTALADNFLGLDSGKIVFERKSENCKREELLAVLSV